MTELEQKQQLVNELVNRFDSHAEATGTLKCHLAWALSSNPLHREAALDTIHKAIGKPVSQLEQAIQFNERQVKYAVEALAYAVIDSAKEHYANLITEHTLRIASLKNGDYGRFTSPELISMNGNDWAKENLGRDS
jgi:hypothetical protein